MTSTASQAATYPSVAIRVVIYVLRQPAVARVRRWLRDARWTIARARTRNPPLPPRVRSALFVCLGNICRSPFAAVLARRVAAERGHSSLRFASAGIRTTQAGASPRDACAAAAAYGVSLDDHVPQSLTRELVEQHDMVFVMEWSQRRLLCATYPDLQDRIFLLSLYEAEPVGAFESLNIVDPFGQRASAFDAAYRRIDRAVRRWLSTLEEQGAC